jgi:hypothetical protein
MNSTPAGAASRNIRKALFCVDKFLAGYMPAALNSQWQRSVPLDHQVLHFPLDGAPSVACEAACQRLLQDPMAPLPGELR